MRPVTRIQAMAYGTDVIPYSVGPTGIEPVPLVLQTSVRTSYTKDPSERYYQLYYPPRRTGWDSNPYLPSQWDTVESNHTLLKATILQTAYHTSD